MTPLLKTGIGVLTVGTLAGTGYASTYLFSYPTEKISDLIEKEYTYILLRTGNNEDTTHWQSAWEAYKTANKGKANDIFGLTGWKQDGSVDVTNKLKEKCNNLKTSFVYDTKDDIYKHVTSYCSRWVTVEDEANKDTKLTVIDTEGSTASSDWSQKERDKLTLQPHIEKLEMTFNSINAEGIKTGCRNAKTKDKRLSNYKEIYEAYKAVCTKTRGS